MTIHDAMPETTRLAMAALAWRLLSKEDDGMLVFERDELQVADQVDVEIILDLDARAIGIKARLVTSPDKGPAQGDGNG